MSYQTLAQKYRPQTFDDVIGQAAVTRTLKNSIASGRIANAYIFCGPRGVGKTSIARLLAKTLNCTDKPQKRPCNKCASCVEITKGNDMDVLEIDGASNNGVDEIRTLRENVKFSPSHGKYKIYIIDEVHMLSAGAFNALLKTLEEPPEHVKFIFATTESHKVLPTIMSRCQRFDFKKIPPKCIFDRLTDIAKKEKIDIDEKAALLIARSSDGSLRDALVVLDQSVSFSEDKILSEDVVELLGVVHRDNIFKLSNAVIENDTEALMNVLDEMISGGKDPVFIATSLISHYRDLMVLKTAKAPTQDMMFTEEEMNVLRGELGKLSLEEILYILQALSASLLLMKSTTFQRAPLEVALIRLTKRRSVLSLPDVITRLENINPGDTFPEKAGDSRGPREKTAKVQEKASSYDTGNKRPIRKESGEIKEPEMDISAVEPDSAELQFDNFETVKLHWKAVLNYIRERKMSVYTFLNVAKPVELNKDKVVIGFGKDHAFNKEALEVNGNREIIEEAVSKVIGNTPRIEFALLEVLSDGAADGEKQREKLAKEKENIKPAIEKAMDIFGGHVVRDFTEGEV